MRAVQEALQSAPVQALGMLAGGLAELGYDATEWAGSFPLFGPECLFDAFDEFLYVKWLDDIVSHLGDL